MMEAIIMNIDIDIEELREDLLNESYGAFFGGVDLRRYEID